MDSNVERMQMEREKEQYSGEDGRREETNSEVNAGKGDGLTEAELGGQEHLNIAKNAEHPARSETEQDNVHHERDFLSSDDVDSEEDEDAENDTREQHTDRGKAHDDSDPYEFDKEDNDCNNIPKFSLKIKSLKAADINTGMPMEEDSLSDDALENEDRDEEETMKCDALHTVDFPYSTTKQVVVTEAAKAAILAKKGKKSHKGVKNSRSPRVKADVTCKICGKTYVRSSNLKIHMFSHTGEKPHGCDICGKRYAHRTSLTIHRVSHTHDKPFKCLVCDKRFQWQSSLEAHHSMHLDNKRYQCDICEKRLATSYSLKLHKRRHTGERPYACDLCDLAFSSSTVLIRHKLVHSGEKPFSCDLCLRTFSRTSSLLRHKLTHMEDKPYRCDICGKSFIGEKELQHHGRRHTGIKPFACDACGKAYSWKSDLRKHRKKYHPDLDVNGTLPMMEELCASSAVPPSRRDFEAFSSSNNVASSTTDAAASEQFGC